MFRQVIGIILLVVHCQAEVDLLTTKCRREVTDLKGETTLHHSRYVRVHCAWVNITTLSSDILIQLLEEPVAVPSLGNGFMGVLMNANVYQSSSSTYMITLENANVAEIEDETFNILNTIKVLNLQSLALPSNKLSKISRRTFEGLGKAENLNLKRNLISVIEPSSFSQMRSLKILSLSENLLSELNYFTFHGLRKLNTLDLSDNNISTLNSGSFASMPELEKLYLSFNRISILDGGILAGLRNLKYLIANGNNIKTIRNGAFGGMAELEMLDVSGNSLSEIRKQTFRGILYIRRLTLRNNKITFVEDGSFESMPLLNELDLSHNGLTTMTRGLFLGLFNLEYFFVSSNWMHETALREFEKNYQDRTLVQTLAIICRMRGLHFADLRWNGIDTLVKNLTVYDLGFDPNISDQHQCIF